MVRIITPGHLPEDKIHEATCGTCRCRFEFKQREARFSPDQRDGDALGIACPTCNREVWIHPKHERHAQQWER